MFAVDSITEEILDLKRQRRAMILAHHYQDSEIQEIADAIGDSLELSRAAQKFDGEVIAFCGVVFMAETAKVLNPSRIVVLPDLDAGCSLVDSCPAAQVRAFRERHPDYVVVSYINTSVEVKAESDILCTSRNAVKIVNSIPAEKPILFLPDINLGNYVKQQTGRKNMKIWQGTCIVHATFAARKLTAARAEHPACAGRRASRMPSRRARHGRFHRLHQRHYRLVRDHGRRRIHRHDRKRRGAFAQAPRAGKAVLLRPQ